MALNGIKFDKKCNLEVLKRTYLEIFKWSTVLQIEDTNEDILLQCTG